MSVLVTVNLPVSVELKIVRAPLTTWFASQARRCKLLVAIFLTSRVYLAEFMFVGYKSKH